MKENGTVRLHVLRLPFKNDICRGMLYPYNGDLIIWKGEDKKLFVARVAWAL
jgi:hypothetical protein